MTRKTGKTEIARQYLDDALRLYSEARFFSSLTLAGAAEEILGTSLRFRGSSDICALDRQVDAMAAFDQRIRDIGGPDFTGQTKSHIRQALVAPRNSAKHFNDQAEVFNFDAQFEAAELIIRAIRNFRLVFPDATDHFLCEEQDISVDQANKIGLFSREGEL